MTVPPLTEPIAAPDELCSQANRASGDDPAGSAAEFTSFLLLDHDGPWSATAADDAVAALGPEVALQIESWPGLRSFAIRPVGGRRATSGSEALRSAARPGWSYGGSVGPGGTLSRWQDAARLDLVSTLTTGGSAGVSTDPLFAVCTNGRRDRCCAIFGRTAANRLHDLFGDQVVEISHLGGHRFAATMLVLPWGYAYGFLDAATAVEVATAAREGVVHPSGLRGRADLSAPAQAAEVLLRREIGSAPPSAVHVLTVETGASGTASVRAEVFGEPVTISMHREQGPSIGHTLCGGKPFATGRWLLDGGGTAMSA